VHCFSIAQTGFPASVAIVGLGAIKHMVLEGRWSVLAHDTRAAYRRGCDAAPMLAAYWERRWEQPLDAVRREFGIVPMPS
jgi:ubiquinone biosynthesis protein Coq4